jgi:hypothetical protein
VIYNLGRGSFVFLSKSWSEKNAAKYTAIDAIKTLLDYFNRFPFLLLPSWLSLKIWDKIFKLGLINIFTDSDLDTSKAK